MFALDEKQKEKKLCVLWFLGIKPGGVSLSFIFYLVINIPKNCLEMSPLMFFFAPRFPSRDIS